MQIFCSYNKYILSVNDIVSWAHILYSVLLISKYDSNRTCISYCLFIWYFHRYIPIIQSQFDGVSYCAIFDTLEQLNQVSRLNRNGYGWKIASFLLLLFFIHSMILFMLFMKRKKSTNRVIQIVMLPFQKWFRECFHWTSMIFT